MADTVRGQGGLMVMDEVESGLTRLGDNMWGFMESGIVPDIVTMGKPMGAGYPLAIVAAKRSIFEAFADADVPLSAYELLEKIRPSTKSVDITTIYRNIEFLSEEGLIHLSGSDGWIACAHLGSACGSVHVVVRCSGCMTIKEQCTTGEESLLAIPGAGVLNGKFKPLNISIHGLCGACQKNVQASE